MQKWVTNVNKNSKTIYINNGQISRKRAENVKGDAIDKLFVWLYYSSQNIYFAFKRLMRYATNVVSQCKNKYLL